MRYLAFVEGLAHYLADGCWFMKTTAAIQEQRNFADDREELFFRMA